MVKEVALEKPEGGKAGHLECRWEEGQGSSKGTEGGAWKTQNRESQLCRELARAWDRDHARARTEPGVMSLWEWTTEAL